MSRIIIYLGLPSPAASSDLPESRPGKPVALCLVLLRMGFTYAPSVTRRAVVSYTAFPPLPGIPLREALSADGGAVYFYCTGLGVTSTGRYPASCPAKPGLSSSEPFRLFSRDYLAWLRKCYSSTFFCTCKEISFITVHSVLSNVAKIHFKLPAAMEFWRVNSNFHSTILHIKAASTDKFS